MIVDGAAGRGKQEDEDEDEDGCFDGGRYHCAGRRIRACRERETSVMRTADGVPSAGPPTSY